MSAAADAEDRTEKHPVTPGVPKPARELYGEMLLERGMPRKRSPRSRRRWTRSRTGWAPLSARRAADKAGDSAKAAEYFAKVVAIAGDADTTRVEVDEARSFLAKRR